jgi:DNA-binding beta-propeller fold protein YncE
LRGPRAHLMGGVAVGVVVVSACFDPQSLPELRYGISEEAVWRDGAPAPDGGRSGELRLLVTNNLSDSVSVISWDALVAAEVDAERSRFPVGLVPIEREGAHHVAISPDGRFAYVGLSNFIPGGGSGPHGTHGTGTAEGHVVQIDLQTQRTIKTTRVDRNPGDVRLSPDGRLLAVSHFDQLRVSEALARGIVSGPELDARLILLDARSLERQRLLSVCPAAHGVAFTSDGRTLVASCLSDEAAVVDVAAALAGRDDAVRRVPLLDAPGTAESPVCGPYAVTMSADSQTAWISCYSSGDLVAVDVATATRGATLSLPGLAVFGDVGDAGDRLAIATQDTDGVAVFAVEPDNTLTLVAFWALPREVCPAPHTVRFLDDDARMAVVCEGDRHGPGRVVAFDVERGEVLGGVELGIFPDDLAVQVVP